jgi:ACR3 family arsenite efflux pump ArsB
MLCAVLITLLLIFSSDGTLTNKISAICLVLIGFGIPTVLFLINGLTIKNFNNSSYSKRSRRSEDAEAIHQIIAGK